jgi:phosphoesterase RecJ-like protein
LSVATDARSRVLEEIRSAEHFLLVTHEHPDGDALGSLVAMHGVLRALGKDSLMFVSAEDLPLPYEYRFFDLDGMVSAPPEDIDGRVVIFLDCGNIDRAPVEAVRAHAAGRRGSGEGSHILNVDHHHDNTLFGDVDLVVPAASCTAEIVWDLMNALGVSPTREIADALYVGLVTDTGKFMYENTGPRAHLMAADLIEAGVDTHDIYRRLYEGMPFAKIELLGRALEHVMRSDGGRLTMTVLTRADFDETGADDSLSEGVIDHLRSVTGTKVAAVVRELPGGDGKRKISLRSTDGEVDVSAIAREAGGGGHRQAAGLTTTMTDDQIVDFLRGHIAAQIGPA